MILKHGTLIVIYYFPQLSANTHSFILLQIFVSQHLKTPLKSLIVAVRASNCRNSKAELCVPNPALELWGHVSPALHGANLSHLSQLWWSCYLQMDMQLTLFRHTGVLQLICTLSQPCLRSRHSSLQTWPWGFIPVLPCAPELPEQLRYPCSGWPQEMVLPTARVLPRSSFQSSYFSLSASFLL